MNGVQKKPFKEFISTLSRNSTAIIGLVLLLMIIVTIIIAPAF